MEKTLSLKAQKRKETGSSSAGKLREQGRIPAIIYGHKEEAVPISLDRHAFTEGIHHGHRLFNCQIGRKREKVIIKDLQYDYLGKYIIHADLVRVNVSETVTVSVPIELKGVAKGAHEGGIVEEHCDHLEIECKVTDIPESIVVSVKELDVGDALHAGDVELGQAVKLVSDPQLLLVTCRVITPKTTEQLEEEAPAAPEVIGEAKEAEEEESAEGEHR